MPRLMKRYLVSEENIDPAEMKQFVRQKSGQRAKGSWGWGSI